MRKIHCLVGLLLSFNLLSGCTSHNSFQANKLASQLQDPQVQVIQKGRQLVLVLPSEISFPTGGNKLKPSVYPLLVRLADILIKDYPTAHIKVIGYTDTSGSPQRNRSLSISRARAVGGYLRYRGVHRDRIDAAGFGDTHPIASNATPEGRAKNRRVEIYID